MTRQAITTHILDLVTGNPAGGVLVQLFESEKQLASGLTDSDGRVVNWSDAFELKSTTYKLVFSVGNYFLKQGLEPFYEDITIAFRASELENHYHVPLLLSHYGYSTYRGS